MSDILVTSPYQPFTLPNQFKAVFNGYIYCGTVDAVDPSVSQAQVYLANEDGSRTPVAQPLRTNAGGFLVYNGQPAKFVTDSNHSLLVRDSLGNQVWYAPDVSTLDPDAFISVLSSPFGSSLIGGALYTYIRAYSGDADRLYCIGRSNMFDGAHGWFKRIATSKADNDGVYLVDALGRTWEREDNEVVNPVWFGALPLGGGDSLPALTAATNFARTRGGLVPPIIRAPGGNYTINGMWEIFDLAQATIILEGPYFSGTASTAQDAVVRINNASNLKIVGSATISANYLANYASAFSVTASAGGVIKPDTGIVSSVDVFGITVRDAKIGFKNGKKELDAQIAELQYHGCEAMFCPVSVYVGGSQTGATYVGCTLASAPGTFALTSKFRVLDMDGGFVQMVGGELINSGVPVGTADHVAIEFKPALSATYSNPFGSIKLSGVHIELTSALFIVASGATPGQLKSVDSNISVSNCGGFIEQPTGGDFATIYESTFAGKIAIDDTCNFYTTQTRTGFNINSIAAPSAKIEVGRTSFGAGFKDWMGGCVGGILYHPMCKISHADTDATQYPQNVTNTVKPTVQSGLAGMSRYGIYTPSNGFITVPKGCRNMTISVYAQSNGFTGDLWVQKLDDSNRTYATSVSGVAVLNMQLIQPTEGDIYVIKIKPISGAAVLNKINLDVFAEF